MKKQLQIAVFIVASIMVFSLMVTDKGRAEASHKNPEVDLHDVRNAREISFNDGKFFVVIQNKTTAPITIWGEQCSWGWSNISFEIRSGDHVLPVERDEINWKHNAPQPVRLLPGDKSVREIRFDDRTWHWDKVDEFCKQHSNAKISTTLKIETDSMAKAENVWSGSVRSAKSCQLEMH